MIITGTNGNDIGVAALYGTEFSDTINGLAGIDQLFGQGGNDILVGGTGDDAIFGGSGFDTVSYAYASKSPFVDLQDGYGRVGLNGVGDKDQLSSIENVWGSNFGDTFYGSEVANELTGRGGRDTLDGRGGADSLSGGSGDDWLFGGAGADRLFGGTGIDEAHYSYSSKGVQVNLGTGKGVGGEAQGDLLDGIENLIGSNHADLLIGNGANNRLESEGGADTLDGGAGADYLNGWGGKDTLTGGTGADVFGFTFWYYTPGPADADTITDFSSTDGDKIDVTEADGGYYESGPTSEFIGTAQFTDGHQVRYSTSAGATIVEVSGEGTSDFATIKLDGIHALQASDFIL